MFLLPCDNWVLFPKVSVQVRVGMSVGHSPEIPQFEPDFPKKESVTLEDMQAAKRRIEGSLAPPTDPSGIQ